MEIAMNAAEKTAKIQAAVAAHFEWFYHIKVAIASGHSDFKPEIVSADNRCVFGKWVYSDMRALCLNDQLYNEIQEIHAEFHRKAGAILDMALRGDKDVATQEIAIGGELASLSGKLALILRRL